MNFQILRRVTGALIFECELAAEITTKSKWTQLGFAIKKAIEAGADLAGADLAGANLAHADLAGANLAHANLAHADLAGADLAGADLAGADLAGADLAGADGIIDLGCPNGWRSAAYISPDEMMRVRVGCRDKTLAEGRDYWRDKDDRREVLAALDYAEAIARLRGWKIALDPEDDPETEGDDA